MEKQIRFEIYFRKELKRLGFKMSRVCDILQCTPPTLKSRINNPGQFTIQEIQKLQAAGFEMNWLTV
jgi:hypothetical protein